MIVYKGHPDFEFVYESGVRGANYGMLVGLNRGDAFETPLSYTVQRGEQRENLLGSLSAREITATTLDGDGVFHGKPRLSMVDATKDAEDVFGKYPKNLRGDKKLVAKKDCRVTRQQFARYIYDLVEKYSKSWQGHRPMFMSENSRALSLETDAWGLCNAFFDEAK